MLSPMSHYMSHFKQLVITYVTSQKTSKGKKTKTQNTWTSPYLMKMHPAHLMTMIDVFFVHTIVLIPFTNVNVVPITTKQQL